MPGAAKVFNAKLLVVVVVAVVAVVVAVFVVVVGLAVVALVVVVVVHLVDLSQHSGARICSDSTQTQKASIYIISDSAGNQQIYSG